MVEQLAQGPRLPCSPGLRAITGIERLVQEEADCPAVVHPRRAVLVEPWCIPQHRQEVDDDEAESYRCDLGPCQIPSKEIMTCAKLSAAVWTYKIGPKQC